MDNSGSVLSRIRMFEGGSSSVQADEPKLPFRALERQLGARQDEIRRRTFRDSSHELRSTQNIGVKPIRTELSDAVALVRTSPGRASMVDKPLNQVPPFFKRTEYEQRSDIEEERAPITETTANELRENSATDEKSDRFTVNDTFLSNPKSTTGDSPGSKDSKDLTVPRKLMYPGAKIKSKWNPEEKKQFMVTANLGTSYHADHNHVFLGQGRTGEGSGNNNMPSLAIKTGGDRLALGRNMNQTEKTGSHGVMIGESTLAKPVVYNNPEPVSEEALPADASASNKVDWPSGRQTIAPSSVHEEKGAFVSQEASSRASSSRIQRLRTMRARSPGLFETTSDELKRNLNAASVVMQEEKASSSSSSSSSRSSLSNEELGNIAKRALQLSSVTERDARSRRMANSPLHKIIMEKRGRKMTVDGKNDDGEISKLRNDPTGGQTPGQANPGSLRLAVSRTERSSMHTMEVGARQHSAPEKMSALGDLMNNGTMASPSKAYVASRQEGSGNVSQAPVLIANEVASRLSNRLSRAERFAALKQKQHQILRTVDETRISSSLSDDATQDKPSTQPVPGYQTTAQPSASSQQTTRKDESISDRSSDAMIPEHDGRQGVQNPKMLNQRIEETNLFPSTYGTVQSVRHRSSESGALSTDAERFSLPVHDHDFSGGADGNSGRQEIPMTCHSYQHLGVKSAQRTKALREQVKKSRDVASIKGNMSSKQVPLSQSLLYHTYGPTRNTTSPNGYSDGARTSDMDSDIVSEQSSLIESTNRRNNSMSSLQDDFSYQSDVISPKSYSQTTEDPTADDIAASDMEDSMLMGETIDQLQTKSSGDESGAKLQPTGTASLSMISQLKNMSSKEGSGRASKKSSSGESQDRQRVYVSSSATSSIRLSQENANKSGTDTSSAGSQVSKPDPLRWWQQNYGEKMPGETNTVVREVLSRMSPSKISGYNDMSSIVEDEDDVFDGLEEDNGDYREGNMAGYCEQVSSSENNDITDDDTSVDDDESGIPPPAYTETKAVPAAKVPSFSHKAPPPPPPKQWSTNLTKEAEVPTAQIDHSGMILDDATGNKSVASDVTSLLSARPRLSSRYRSNLVTTIEEASEEEDIANVEPPVPPIDQMLDSTPSIIEESGALLDESAPVSGLRGEHSTDAPISPGMVIFNMGCTLWETLKTACKIPDKLPMPISAECAKQTENKCSVKASECADKAKDVANKTREALKFKRHLENMSDELNTEHETKTSFVQSYASTLHDDNVRTNSTSFLTLNDEERRIWHAWEARERQLTIEERNALTELQSEPSTSFDTQMKEHHQEERHRAQKRLIEYANRAMKLHGSPTKAKVSSPHRTEAEPQEQTLEQINSDDEEQLGSILTPRSLSGAVSFEQRAVLENFSSKLKNHGVEVLKLGRRNNWQIRYLTVSREVAFVCADESNGDIGQCPKALLWLKQFNAHNYSVSAIKTQGRGGLLFSNLNKLEIVDTQKYFEPALPKKLRKAFPIFAGVNVYYSFDGAERQLLLCFKDKGDAQAFCTAMEIIKEVVSREDKSLTREERASSHPMQPQSNRRGRFLRNMLK